MKKIDGKWHIQSVNDLLGWEIADGVVGTLDNQSGLVVMRIRHKTTGEERTVRIHPLLVPAESLENKQDNR